MTTFKMVGMWLTLTGPAPYSRRDNVYKMVEHRHAPPKARIGAQLRGLQVTAAGSRTGPSGSVEPNPSGRSVGGLLRPASRASIVHWAADRRGGALLKRGCLSGVRVTAKCLGRPYNASLVGPVMEGIPSRLTEQVRCRAAQQEHVSWRSRQS